jgi:hypothetical protein
MDSKMNDVSAEPRQIEVLDATACTFESVIKVFSKASTFIMINVYRTPRTVTAELRDAVCDMLDQLPKFNWSVALNAWRKDFIFNGKDKVLHPFIISSVAMVFRSTAVGQTVRNHIFVHTPCSRYDYSDIANIIMMSWLQCINTMADFDL